MFQWRLLEVVVVDVVFIIVADVVFIVVVGCCKEEVKLFKMF